MQTMFSVVTFRNDKSGSSLLASMFVGKSSVWNAASGIGSRSDTTDPHKFTWIATRNSLRIKGRERSDSEGCHDDDAMRCRLFLAHP